MPVRSASICWPRIWKKSKYASQNDMTTTRPSTAATMTPVLSAVALAPRPIAISDSPIAMMMISPCRSTKCAGSTRQPPIPTTSGPRNPTASATTQSIVREPAVGEPRGENERGAGEGRGSDSQDRRQQVSVAARPRSERVQREMHDVHDQKGNAEHDPVPAERVGDGQCGDEHRGHRNQDRAPHRFLFGIDSVGQPGVGRPGPPERRQDQKAVPEPAPGRIIREDRRHLGEREDEDEVEEELERGDSLLALNRLLAHSRTLTAQAIEEGFGVLAGVLERSPRSARVRSRPSAAGGRAT